MCGLWGRENAARKHCFRAVLGSIWDALAEGRTVHRKGQLPQRLAAFIPQLHGEGEVLGKALLPKEVPESRLRLAEGEAEGFLRQVDAAWGPSRQRR